MRGEYLLADGDVGVELFPQLASQTGGERLARLAFAAGELPEPLEVNSLLTFRDQEPAVTLDDGGADDDGFHDLPGSKGNERQSLVIGQIRHLGLRATHTIAPKSISA